VLISAVGPNHLVVDLDVQDPELFRVLNLIGAKGDGVCKVSVTVIREGLTDEICYKNFQERAARLAEELRAQPELPL